MTKNEQETQCARVSNNVYAACVKVFELLESEHAIVGNGHHMAQKVAKFAEDLLRERFNAPTEDEQNHGI